MNMSLYADIKDLYTHASCYFPGGEGSIFTESEIVSRPDEERTPRIPQVYGLFVQIQFGACSSATIGPRVQYETWNNVE